MKKVTIITPPEFEGMVLESLGRARVTQLKPVTGPDFEELRSHAREIDFGALYQKVHSYYERLLELGEGDIERVTPSNEELRRFTSDPEGEVEALLQQLEHLIARLQELREAQQKEREEAINRLQAAIQNQISSYEEARTRLERELSKLEREKREMGEEVTRRFEAVKARFESVRALEPEEFKSCFAVGLVRNELIPRLEEYLKSREGIFHRTVSVSPEKSFLFVFGSEEGRKWVDALFLVFEVEDVFDVLDARDILLVLDPEKRREALERYEAELKRIKEEMARISEKETRFENEIDKVRERLQRLDATHNQNVEKLKGMYAEELKQLEERQAEELKSLQGRYSEALGRIAYVDYLLKVLSDKKTPVLRTNVISILQGWVPDYMVPKLEKAIAEVESKTGERLYFHLESPGPDDQNIPTPEPEIRPKVLQPAWKLTTLRGWPSAHEINPAYITILVFCFQFGMMYGDIGQGLILLLLGIFLSRRYKRGMMSRLSGVFVPMGVSAIIFGFLYDSIFLVEGLLFHHHQIMPNPVENTTRLMLLVFNIAAIEVIIGLALGAVNEIRHGNPIGALGEHGLGMVLYVAGLYLSALRFIKIGMDFMPVLSYWTFYVMIAGMALSFLEPIIHSVVHGHGIGVEVIGEGVGGLLMTFVEGLANLFSYLRVVAFALAHASLAIAAEALTHSLGIAGIGLVIMNIVALTFELISSSVQSLRLLYYEFMGKFFHGGGVPFRPFRIGARQRPSA